MHSDEDLLELKRRFGRNSISMLKNDKAITVTIGELIDELLELRELDRATIST